MFKVTIDFGDDSVMRPRTFESFSELTSYLERVPSMLGFAANPQTHIIIEHLERDPC